MSLCVRFYGTQIIFQNIFLRTREFVWKVFDEFLAGNVGDGAEKDNRSYEARMTQHHSFISWKFAEGLGKHHVIPMILNFKAHKQLMKKLYTCKRRAKKAQVEWFTRQRKKQKEEE